MILDSIICSFDDVNSSNYLILFKWAVRHGFVSFLLKRDDDESNENVNEEEWENDEEYNVEEADFHPEPRFRTSVLVRWSYRVP